MKEPMMADSHEITVRNYKQPMRNRLIMMLICIGIALTSFFVVSKWATSVESYRWVIKTLNGLQKKALGLSGTATALQQVLQQYREKPQLRSRISWQMSQAIW